MLGAFPEEVVDVVVTCDGTWSKRGFTATYGIVVVIAWDTFGMRSPHIVAISPVKANIMYAVSSLKSWKHLSQ